MVVPLLKEYGFVNYIVQYESTSNESGRFIITPLAEYQKSGAAAPVRMLAEVWGDLLVSHNLGLIRISFDEEHLSRGDCNKLIRTVLNLYCMEAGYKWVYAFNHTPQLFDFDAFLTYLNPKESY